ncbi:hemolysin family protein [Microvirga sp. W0021]|uniref:Hemolysin family protein n=1 Tax=Hohaiivirga grylli TaxID=3133970 RepID=A0ABV0BHI4_9HYPH
MNEDRSRDEPSSPQAEEPDEREHWYNRFMQYLRLKGRESIRDELEDALSETTSEDDGFSPQEKAMLKNVLGFHRIRVDDLMVPRADIVAVSTDTTLAEIFRLFQTAGHSRFPVYDENLDDPKGMIHIRDFLAFLGGYTVKEAVEEEDTDTLDLGKVDLSVPLGDAKILRPVLFVPPSMPAVDLLVRMQSTRTHLALVIDEYGGTDGLVALEDLVESVVGDIEDEHDDVPLSMITTSGNGSFIADARASLEEVSEAINFDLDSTEEAEDVDTIGGFIVTLSGRVPSRGELIPGPDHLEFEILDADPRRVKRIRISRREPEPEVSETESLDTETKH